VGIEQPRSTLSISIVVLTRLALAFLDYQNKYWRMVTHYVIERLNLLEPITLPDLFGTEIGDLIRSVETGINVLLLSAG